MRPRESPGAAPASKRRFPARSAAAGACNPRACGVARDERACGAAGGVSVGKGSVCDTCAGSSTTSTTVTTTTSTSSTSTTASTTATTSTATTSTTLAAGVTYGNDV